MPDKIHCLFVATELLYLGLLFLFSIRFRVPSSIVLSALCSHMAHSSEPPETLSKEEEFPREFPPTEKKPQRSP